MEISALMFSFGTIDNFSAVYEFLLGNTSRSATKNLGTLRARQYLLFSYPQFVKITQFQSQFLYGVGGDVSPEKL